VTKTDAILVAIKAEFERRPHALDSGGLRSVHLHLHFDRDRATPRTVVMHTEFESTSDGGTEVT